LFGVYDSRVIYGQSRVLVAWNRIIFPDGSAITLGAMPGADMSGYAGFNDEVNNHYLPIVRLRRTHVAHFRRQLPSPWTSLNVKGNTSSNVPSMQDEMASALASQLRPDHHQAPGEKPQHQADARNPARLSVQHHRDQGHGHEGPVCAASVSRRLISRVVGRHGMVKRLRHPMVRLLPSAFALLGNALVQFRGDTTLKRPGSTASRASCP